MSEAESSAGPGGPDSVPAAGKLTTQSPINVTLPDSLRNMVFLQAASCWLLACLGALGLIWGGLSLLNEGRSEEAVAGVVVGLVVTFLAGAGLLVLHYGVWRPALQGRYAAIVALYVFHVLFLLVAPLVAVMAVFVIGDVLVSGFALMAGLIVLGIMWLIALTNLFERELWAFARLDGQCPACRNWAFGRVRRPGTITCGRCGAVLQFERAS